jgi:hypothetical protein
MKYIITIAMTLAGLLFGGMATAHADAGDVMLQVGSEIAPGTYRYAVTGNDMGAWKLCSDARCDVGAGMIDMDTVDGEGHTGYLTVPSSAKYVKLHYLTLSPMR